MKTKFKIIAAFALILWLVVWIQIAITRFFVYRTDFTEAFTRNQVSVTAQNDKTFARGQIRGELSRDQMSELAAKLFRTLGGVTVMESDPYTAHGYYMAYGFSTGFDKVKRVNGRRINMNIAMSYDEERDCTNIIMASPIVNLDV